jgi:hypothetical protein
MTTFVLVAPLAALPAPVAAAVFFGLSAGLLAFVLIPHGRWRLLMFASPPMFQAATSAQWSPFLIACSLCLPAIGCLAVKPNLALPLMAMQTRSRAWWSAVIGGTILLAIAFALQPHWLPEWLTETRIARRLGGYRIPILSPLGAVLALALLRWRRPEGRLLLVMSCIPQKMMFYDQLPLLLIPRSKREMQWAVAASLAAVIVASRHPWGTPEATTQLTPPVIVGLFWPALVMLLMRPNTTPPSSRSAVGRESAADGRPGPVFPSYAAGSENRPGLIDRRDDQAGHKNSVV